MQQRWQWSFLVAILFSTLTVRAPKTWAADQKSQKNAKAQRLENKNAKNIRKDFLAAGDWYLEGANIFSTEVLSEQNPMDITDLFHENQIRVLAEVGEIQKSLHDLAEEKIQSLGERFAREQGGLIENHLSRYDSDPAFRADFDQKSGAAVLERLRNLKKLKDEKFEEFKWQVGLAQLKFVLAESELENKFHAEMGVATITNDLGTGKLTVLRDDKGGFRLISKIVHRASQLSFLIGDFDPESSHAQRYLGRQLFDARVPTLANPTGDAKVRGMDTVIISARENETSLRMEPRVSILSKAWWKNYIAATHVPTTKEGAIFGAICGGVQGAATACVGSASRAFFGGHSSWWEPMLISMTYGTTIGTWIDTFLNWSSRGGVVLQGAKSLAVGLSYAWAVDIARHHGLEHLLTISDPSGRFMLGMSGSQQLAHVGILLNKLVSSFTGARWDKWSDYRDKYGIDAHPVKIEIKIPGTEKVILSYETQEVDAAAAHRQLVVNMIPFVPKMLGLAMNADFRIGGVPMPIAQGFGLVLAPFSHLASLRTLEALKKLPQFQESEMLEQDIVKVRAEWEWRRRLLYGWMVDPMLKLIGRERKVALEEIVDPELHEARLKAEIEQRMALEIKRRARAVMNKCELFLLGE